MNSTLLILFLLNITTFFETYDILGVNGETMESFHIEENASDVCDMLRNVVNRHSLSFNPNLCEEGVRGTLDPHGLVLVLACGTLHNQHTVCGVFEQVINKTFRTWSILPYHVFLRIFTLFSSPIYGPFRRL